jgi:DNA-binding HxlR family transcriptional regulator
MVESIVGCKWSVAILCAIADGTVRPGLLQRALPGLSAKVMNERLAKLLRYGIVERTARGTKPPIEVEYTLTPLGRRFEGLIAEVRRLQADLERTP